MPSLGTDMTAGRLVEWHVQPGDHVTRGDIIAVVETEKGIIDITERLLDRRPPSIPGGHT